jgi:hypothetical protein
MLGGTLIHLGKAPLRSQTISIRRHRPYGSLSTTVLQKMTPYKPSMASCIVTTTPALFLFSSAATSQGTFKHHPTLTTEYDHGTERARTELEDRPRIGNTLKAWMSWGLMNTSEDSRITLDTTTLSVQDRHPAHFFHSPGIYVLGITTHTLLRQCRPYTS